MSDTTFWSGNFPAYLESISTFFAALFGGIALIYAYKAYKKDSSEQQNQIDALSQQTQAVKESSNINSQVLLKLTELVANNIEITKLQKESAKLNMRPFFSGFQTLGDGLGNSVYSMINKGEDTAIFKSVSLIDNNNQGFSVRKSENSPDRIGKDGQLDIVLDKGVFQGGWNNVNCNIELRFSDKTEKNNYIQIITHQRGVFKIGNTIEDK